MTVSDLISILQQHDPAAVVVTRWDVYDFDTLVLTFEELHHGAVQAVPMCKLPEAVGWDPLGGAMLYEELLSDDAADATKGVLLG